MAEDKKIETNPAEAMQETVAVTAAVVDERVIKGRDEGGEVSDKKKFYYTKKVCKFCTKQIEEKSVIYKNVDLLRRFVMPSGKILPRRISGNCAKHQRRVVEEVKKARIMAFLPFLDR